MRIEEAERALVTFFLWRGRAPPTFSAVGVLSMITHRDDRQEDPPIRVSRDTLKNCAPGAVGLSSIASKASGEIFPIGLFHEKFRR